MKRVLPLLLLAACGLAHAADPTKAETVDAALAAAQREHRPVFLDFQAQWCYSCYFMATHVLTGPQWQTLEKRMRVLEVDADSPDGAAWMKKLGVKALPSFVVLKPDGSELGRIVAEQPAAKFYPALERILGGGDALESLQAKAQQGSLAAIADVLAGFHARSEYDAALAWYAKLPPAIAARADADAHVTLWRERSALEIAAKGFQNFNGAIPLFELNQLRGGIVLGGGLDGRVRRDARHTHCGLVITEPRHEALLAPILDQLPTVLAGGPSITASCGGVRESVDGGNALLDVIVGRGP